MHDIELGRSFPRPRTWVGVYSKESLPRGVTAVWWLSSGCHQLVTVPLCFGYIRSAREATWHMHAPARQARLPQDLLFPCTGRKIMDCRQRVIHSEVVNVPIIVRSFLAPKIVADIFYKTFTPSYKLSLIDTDTVPSNESHGH